MNTPIRGTTLGNNGWYVLLTSSWTKITLLEIARFSFFFLYKKVVGNKIKMGFAISQYHLWVSQEHPFLVNVLWNLCKKHHRCSLLFVDERESNGLTKKQSVYIQVFVFVKCKNSCKKIYLWLKSHKKVLWMWWSACMQPLLFCCASFIPCRA